MVPDPKKPYKVYALIVATMLTTFITEAGANLPWYATAVIISLVAGIAVYVTPNPSVGTRKKRPLVRDQETLF